MKLSGHLSILSVYFLAWFCWHSWFSNAASILSGAKEWSECVLQRAFDREGAYAAQLLVSLWSSLWSQEHHCWCSGSRGQPNRIVKTPESCSPIAKTCPGIFSCYIRLHQTAHTLNRRRSPMITHDQGWSNWIKLVELVVSANLAGVASTSQGSAVQVQRWGNCEVMIWS